MGVPKYFIKKPSCYTWLYNEILRHTPVYFLAGCSSAEPASALTGNANVKHIQD